VAAGAERERDRDAVQGMIRVIEGSAGHVSAGVEVPVSARALTPYGVREERGLVRAASGFDVTPQVLGDGRVRLEIAPFDERLAAPSAGGTVVERAGASTAITVMPGEKVAIGSLARESTSGGVGFVGIGREESREERVILVWVDLEE
jgi:type II secretory pathway component HofQ